MNDRYGFNLELAEKINLKLNELDTRSYEIIDYYNYKIFNTMAESWFAPEALLAYQDIYEKFRSFCADRYYFHFNVRHMLYAATSRWCVDTGTEDITVWWKNLPENPPYADKNKCKEVQTSREDGFVGIIADKIDELITNIKNLELDMGNLLSQYSNFFNEYGDALCGANQMQNYQAKINELRNNLKQKVEEMINIASTRIQETKENYMDTAKANAQLFASGN